MRRAVITGIGAVSPNGIGRERFWKATQSGVSGVRRITRFDPSNFVVQVAGEVPDEFDEHKWVEVKDRPHVSRAVPLAAASVAEACEDAGLDPKSMSRDELREIGVIVGSGGGSQEFTEEQYRLYYTGHLKQCSVYTIPTSTIGTLASEVSMRFGFRGLSHIVSTGCTSSTDAIGYAMRHIQAGVLDTMVAGGVDAPIAPLILRGFQLDAHHEHALESRAEARLPALLARPRRVRDRRGRLVLRHGGDGDTPAPAAPTSTARWRATDPPARPTTGCAWRSAAKNRRAPSGMAMKEAGICRRRTMQYINYHGTSTELNDRIETRAVKLAFNGHAYKLAGSSLKSLIGHPQGACGAAGVAATLLAMRDGVVPPTINVDEPDPECDLDYIPGRPAAADRVRRGQLHRLRQQELGAGVAKSVR